MVFADIVKILKKNGNCYVNDMPTANRIARLKHIFNCEIEVKPTLAMDSGYIITLLKEVK